MEGILLAFFFGFLPSLIWLVFFLKEDDHPEPKKLIFKTFIFGVISSFAAILFQSFSLKALSILEISRYSLISFSVLSLIEEIVKFLAAYLATRKSEFFDEPIDAMIYMMTAAMGFAAAENIFAVIGDPEKEILTIEIIFGVLVLRFIGATLLHALSSMIIGYYWAKKFILDKSILHKSLIVGKIKNSNIFLFKGFVIAVLLHTIFNFLVIKYNALAIYPIIFLIIAALFIFWNFEKLKRDTNG